MARPETLAKGWNPPTSGWSRRAVYLPPLTREWWLQRLPGSAAVGAIGVAILFVSPYSGSSMVPIAATGIAILGALCSTLPFTRSWPVWDLIQWENKRTLPKARPDQAANLACLVRAGRAVTSRRPAAVRAELRDLAEPDSWVIVVAEFLKGEADIMEGTPPHTALLRERLPLLDGDYLPSAKVMLAVLDSGSEWLAGRDWRPRLVTCRTELGIHFSLWRALFPVRNVLILLAAMPVVPWAWFAWGGH
jgi:hypothetical protein